MTVLGIFIVVAGLISSLVIGLQYYFSSELAEVAAENSFRAVSEKTRERILTLDSQSANLVGMLSHFNELEKFPEADQVRRSLPLLAGSMEYNPSIYAVYVGYESGEFFELVNLESSNIVRNSYGATPSDRWVIVKVTTVNGVREKTTIYLDSAFNVRADQRKPAVYDPRERPWFKEAVTSSDIIKTRPYTFANLKAPGVTYARSVNYGQRVIGVDISLAGLSGFLDKQRVMPDSQAFLYDKNGNIIAQASGNISPNQQREAGVEDINSSFSERVPNHLFVDLAATVSSEGDLRLMIVDGRECFGYLSHIESIYGSNDYLGLLVPVGEMMQPYMQKVRFSFLVTIVILLFLAPLVWYLAAIIVKPMNALAQESLKVKLRRYDEVDMVQSNISEVNYLSKSMVSMASSIEEYEKSLEALMESFIKLIATAIDYKSPYTGGHCARVPKLSIMLAEVANTCTDKPFAGFSFTTEEEWREFKTACWLHDCGKVATPEHVVDKATKLEAIYNRIHEIRMRFEVLLRDAEIDYWQGIANGDDKATLAKTLDAKQNEIKEDFSFIAECNLGGEFLAEDKIERIRKIAEKTWIRNLDNRQGLGHLELLLYPEEAPVLPCEEKLLDDRQEHIVLRTRENSIGSADTRFAVDAPENLYNLGEIYNLCIRRGTLTDEDRYKINEHVIITISMLETLPFPENMTRVPEYAGTHHETLIGTGYPRRLTRNEIGMPGRIVALADVFEALTASDRPYKKAKKLSEALKILSFMVKDEHLDADIFRLFLESGVYMEYARQFLDPSQIDDVDIAQFL